MKVVVVDDSAIIRAIFEQNLNKENGIDIIASVSNGRKAIDFVKFNKPDIILSDIDMPEMDGIEATHILSKQMKIPVILFSDDEAKRLDAKAAGACEFVQKPSLANYDSDFFKSLHELMNKYAGGKSAFSSSPIGSRSRISEIDISGHSFINRVLNKNIKVSSSENKTVSNYSSIKSKLTGEGYKVLCIGASTGGPTAVASVLKGLGHNYPLPILYAQHVDTDDDKKMAEWFSSICTNVNFKLAKNGEEALPGTVYMAPADTHLVIDFVKTNGHPVISLSDEPPERFLKPAVNKLFRSAASFYGKFCLAILLTGMGRDGAEGCKMIVDNGGHTIVEDKSTCAVFGMPAAAIEVGGANEILPREEIAPRILSLSGGN